MSEAKETLVEASGSDEKGSRSPKLDPNGIVDEYLSQADWKVKENSNVSYSLSGLMLHATDTIIRNYTLEKVYPDEVTKAHREGAFHIHDLGMGITGYCAGWSLGQLLAEGLNGVPGKVACSPPKHLDTALLQIVNFLGATQNEFAGAQAFSSVDTYLAPFVREDGMDYREVKQAMQTFMFNLNSTSRWGGQCVSEDTEALTSNGWKKYWEIKEEDEIATFNIETEKVEYLKPDQIAVYDYDGYLIRLKNRIQDQLVTPNHRVVRKKFNAEKSPDASNFEFVEAEDLFNFKTPPLVPISGISSSTEEFVAEWEEGEIYGEGLVEGLACERCGSPVRLVRSGAYQCAEEGEFCRVIPTEKGYGKAKSDEICSDAILEIIAWTITEGNLDERGRIYIYQSVKNQENCEEIRGCLKEAGFSWDEREEDSGFGGPCVRFRLGQSSSRKIRKYLNDIHKIPDFISRLSPRQIKLFVDTYAMGDGSGNPSEAKQSHIYTKDKETKDRIQALCSLCGYGTTNRCQEHNGVWEISLIRHDVASITNLEKVPYRGKVWCPTSKNGTFIARRKGKVFITGNTLFTNITLDWTVPEPMKGEHVVVGGEIMDRTYEDYQEEMDMINRALIEVMLEGDMNGRPFTFPIPTYNVTPEFPWDSENSRLLFEMTAKYGLPYFQNFVNSDLNPEDVRSMCCLTGDTKIISKGDRGISYRSIRDIRNTKDPKVLIEGRFEPAEWIELESDEIVKVRLANNLEIKMTPEHLCITKDGIKRADELTEEDWMPFSLRGYEGEGGSPELGRFIGLFVAEGSFNDNGIVFSLSPEEDGLTRFIKDFASKYYGANSSSEEVKQGVGNGARVVRIFSKPLMYLVRSFIGGRRAHKKHLKSKVFGMSREFREGFWKGWREGDNTSRGRICTSSEILAEDAVALISSLGSVAGKYTDKRGSAEGKLGNRNLYMVRPYSFGSSNESRIPSDRKLKKARELREKGLSYRKIAEKVGLSSTTVHRWLNEKVVSESGKRTFYKDVYELDEDRERVWIKIKKISEEERNNKVYDFSMNTDGHVFQLANGLITHNCRLQLDKRELMRNMTGGLFGSGEKTGSLGVVTINMPQIGYLSESKVEFFEQLEFLMNLARISLERKREIVERNMERGLMPYSKRYLGTMENHFSTIGLNGMNEATLNLLGADIVSREGHEFAEETLEFMRDRLKEFQEATGNLYNLEATPAEGTCYRLARIDKRKYPDIITAGDGTPYYTNSTQLPSPTDLDLFESLEHQEPLQNKYTGGTVFHMFLGERLYDGESSGGLLRKVCHNTRLPYVTLTPTYSICQNHGYLAGEQPTCQSCGEETEVYSRVVGYYRPVKNWNEGKQEEFKDRPLYEAG